MAKANGFTHHPAIRPHDLRRVAVCAVIDPRSVVKYLMGVSILEMTRLRVERGLRACGLEHLVGYATRAAATAAANDQAHAGALSPRGATNGPASTSARSDDPAGSEKAVEEPGGKETAHGAGERRSASPPNR